MLAYFDNFSAIYYRCVFCVKLPVKIMIGKLIGQVKFKPIIKSGKLLRSATAWRFLFSFSVYLAVLIGFAFFFSVPTLARNSFSEVEIRLVSTAPARIVVSGKIETAMQNWRFADSYAGIENLSQRQEKCEFFDRDGKPQIAQKHSFGVFLTEKPTTRWRCEINVETLLNFQAIANLSWLTEERGLLLLNDLLPKLATVENEKIAAEIRFALPAEWRVSTGESRGANELEFNVTDSENAVFLIGKDWRETKISVGVADFTLATAGEHAFSDLEAVQIAREILLEYQQTFGSFPKNEMQLILLPFPKFVNAARRQAETRNSVTVLIAGEYLTKGLALNRLHEMLRHEFFHFWLPNGINLSGSYDWFYEGFALYQSLRVGLKTKTIRFEDFLDTLSRSFDAAKAQNNDLSLLDASRKRFQGNDLLIYSKGMTVAFLCDLAILREGKHSFEEIFREIYTKHGLKAERADGNTVILQILKQFSPQVREIVEKYVETSARIEWENNLNEVGLSFENSGGNTKLQISDKLNGRKRDLLKKLSYNSLQK